MEVRLRQRYCTLVHQPVWVETGEEDEEWSQAVLRGEQEHAWQVEGEEEEGQRAAAKQGPGEEQQREAGRERGEGGQPEGQGKGQEAACGEWRVINCAQVLRQVRMQQSNGHCHVRHHVVGKGCQR